MRNLCGISSEINRVYWSLFRMTSNTFLTTEKIAFSIKVYFIYCLINACTAKIKIASAWENVVALELISDYESLQILGT